MIDSGEPKMVSKTVLGIVCAIATGVLLFTVANVRDIHDHSKALVRGWEAYGPHTTAVGRLRVLLASLTWLGPLRPNALMDPLRECGMPQANDGWWTARRRLACLEDHIAKAVADHRLFERKLIINITVSFLALVYFLQAKVPRDVPEFSLSGKVILGNARLAEQRQSWNYSSGHISRHRRLKDDEKAALSRRRRKKAGKKVLRGEVAEVLAEGGLLRGKDGRVYLFSLEVCFLYGVCLHKVEPSEVLHVGMTVEFEVTERRRSRRNKAVEAAVQRVWIEGEDASLAFPPTDSMIESWCSGNGVSSATRDALKQEAELLSPSLFPTALKMETTTTVDITS